MNKWMDIAKVAEPPRVARLAKDGRGYPIPHTVLFGTDGKPDFRVIDKQKWTGAVNHKRCGVCGDTLGRFLAFVGGPKSIESRLFVDLPMHRDCATYAIQVCPFLAAPKYAYSRSVPDAATVVESVSTDRPDTFGLAIAKGFRPVFTGAGEYALQATEFLEVEWWIQGQRSQLAPFAQ